MIEFKDRLRELMNENGIKTPTELSEKLDKLNNNSNLHSNTIRNYLNGKSPKDVGKYKILANFFGVSTDYLQGYTKERTNNIDIKNIYNEYGLNENSLEIIKKYNKELYSESINDFIESQYFQNFCKYIYDTKLLTYQYEKLNKIVVCIYQISDNIKEFSKEEIDDIFNIFMKMLDSFFEFIERYSFNNNMFQINCDCFCIKDKNIFAELKQYFYDKDISSIMKVIDKLLKMFHIIEDNIEEYKSFLKYKISNDMSNFIWDISIEEEENFYKKNSFVENEKLNIKKMKQWIKSNKEGEKNERKRTRKK